jgi:RNA polymerase sigma-70 factor (ECF subfamily)
VKGHTNQIEEQQSNQRSASLAVVRGPSARPHRPRASNSRAPIKSADRVDLPDDALLRDVYAQHGRALFEFVFNHTSGDRQWAEDIVQETMVRLWRNVERIDFVRDLRPLLFTVARRLIIDGYRRRRVRPAEVGEAALAEIPATDELDRSLVALTVKRALGTVAAPQRAVIVALYYQGRTIQSTASELGIPAGTVKSRAYNGLCALRTALERLGVVSAA